MEHPDTLEHVLHIHGAGVKCRRSEFTDRHTMDSLAKLVSHNPNLPHRHVPVNRIVLLAERTKHPLCQPAGSHDGASNSPEFRASIQIPDRGGEMAR